MHAVIHHGGSGTTYPAFRHGCASMIISHILDQYVWNRIVHNIGAGPRGVPIGKLAVQILEPKILDLMHNPVYKQNAGEISRRMAGEDYRDELYQTIID